MKYFIKLKIMKYMSFFFIYWIANETSILFKFATFIIRLNITLSQVVLLTYCQLLFPIYITTRDPLHEIHALGRGGGAGSA